eukprot:1821269-Amphidinium_carterae.1
MARAAGWAMVQLDANGLLQILARVSCGAVPSTLCPVQSSAEAELSAMGFTNGLSEPPHSATGRLRSSTLTTSTLSHKQPKDP